jgi:hypothetical protein
MDADRRRSQKRNVIPTEDKMRARKKSCMAQAGQWRWGVELAVRFLGSLVGAVIGHWPWPK